MSFKKKIWKIAMTQLKEKSLFYQLFLRNIFYWITREKNQVTPTPLYYTALHPPRLYHAVQCSVQGYTLIQCSVVQWCWSDLEICPSNPSKNISQKTLKKTRIALLFWSQQVSKLQKKKIHRSGQILVLVKQTHMSISYNWPCLLNS